MGQLDQPLLDFRASPDCPLIFLFHKGKKAARADGRLLGEHIAYNEAGVMFVEEEVINRQEIRQARN